MRAPVIGNVVVVVLLAFASFKHTFAFTVYEKASLCCGRSRLLPSPSTFKSLRQPPPKHVTASYDRVTASSTATHAGQKRDDTSYDGVGRGQYIFVVVLFICIWQFSIPPTFRRAKFCPPACAKERTLCRNPCVTVEEWTNDIVQYYRNGGGIQWDFSIDPNTLAENERFAQNLFGNNK